MKVQVLGVRGSTGAPGSDFVRYGGHTACLAVWTGDDAAPSLLLDAGTGLRNVPGILGAGRPFTGTIALSHLHWDHVQGLPFCPAVDHDDAHVRVVMPEQGHRTGFELLAQAMAPPAFPIDPGGLRGSWTFDVIDVGLVEGCQPRLTAFSVAHKGGRTFGFRVDADGASLAYLPDHAPQAGVSDATLEALQGVDVMIHDAQFLSHESVVADAYGHATIESAKDLAAKVSASRLVLFHHAPGRTDAALDAIAADLGARPGDTSGEIVVAAEGMVLDL
jgi:ribonuclease BN (tRNA processing enzyme)